MKIAFHGGKCCGIKVIHGFGTYPQQFDDELVEDRDDPDNDVRGEDVSSAMNFFYGSAPAETLVERLDRYLAFLKEHRPGGIVEVCLAQSEDYDEYEDETYDQVTPWRPILEERGFKEVVNFVNSNSDNRVFIFHLLMGA